MTRQLHKVILRQVAEEGLKRTLGRNVPRHLRRELGRTYANEAYRIMRGGTPFRDSRCTPALVMWIANEYDQILKQWLEQKEAHRLQLLAEAEAARPLITLT